jgi:uncharacterized protein YacL
MMTKVLTLIGASLMAFALFGLTFSALLDDGVLKATSAGLLFGMLGFMVTLLIARMLADLSQ